MAQITLLAHIPRLRMEVDQVQFPSLGALVKLTWESYDSMTLGAFSDWERRYVEADPVFLHLEVEADLPFVKRGSAEATSMAEMKFSSTQWYNLIPEVLGTRLLTGFHDVCADVVWQALMLAVPGAAPGWPRTSNTICIPEDGWAVGLGGDLRSGLRIQGEADQEYVYSADTAARPLTDDEVVLAQRLVPVVQRLSGDERLGAALRQLMSTTEPTLTPGDRLVLAVSALEGLLLPEIRTGQQDALAERVSALLGPSAEPSARDLYRIRSRAVHDGPDSVRRAIQAGTAEQLLADVLLATDGTAKVEHGGLRGWAPAERLLPRKAWMSATLTAGVNLSAAQGHTVSWSPLVGLTYDGDNLLLPGGATLTTLSPREIVSMEEKDIRRDFIQRLVLDGMQVAGLAVVDPAGGDLSVDDSLMARLLRPRDLTVAGLRIAGFDRFVDPEILGWYVYRGSVRHRRETVLRQTALMVLGAGDHTPLTGEALAAASGVWTTLAAYARQGTVPEIDRMLDVFRRTFDAYTRAGTRATLLFALLESLLGRFRPAKSAVQLEHLVAVLAHARPADASWFAAEGRRIRNASAHGAWQPSNDDEDLARLRRICGAALHELLAVWAAARDHSRAPSAMLVDHLRGRLM